MLKSSFKLRNCFGFLLGLFIFLFTTTSVFASQNIVSTVTISNAKEDVSGYELEVDSTQAVTYKTKTVENNGIIFELKNSILAQNPATYYDDVKGIDSVIVEQYGKNKVRIFIQGKDAANTELVFVNSIFEAAKDKKSIIINRPISQYQPISQHSTDLDAQGDNQDWDDNSFNFIHLSSAILSNLKDGAMGIVLIFALVFAIILAVIKNIARNYSQDIDPLIGLNNVNTIKDVPSAFSQNIPKMNSSLESVSSRSETIKNAQKELAKAHQKYQEYLQDKYKNRFPEKQKTANVDAVRKGIALNQYQKSSQNPYTNQEVLRMSEAFSRIPQNNKDSFQIPPRPKKEINKDFTSPYIQRKTNTLDYSAKPQLKTKDNSMRFLESVTKIYEQSGRGDLANGLKNSISKVKQSL